MSEHNNTCNKQNNELRRGSTPTNTFSVNIDLRGATIFVSYAQRGKVLVEKTGSDLYVTEDTIITRLTQEDTLQFKPGEVSIQLRYVKADGEADTSNVIQTTAELVLKDGVIDYV